MTYMPRVADVVKEVQLSREESIYYARHLLLPSVGARGQMKLKAARVLVVGAGGLGCPLLQALAGAGVGLLTVVDGDQVALSNLARQWLHQSVDLGTNKAESAQRSLKGLNPYIQVAAVPVMLDEANAAELVGSHDIVVDATDDLEARYLIDDFCTPLNRPWVHGALYRDTLQICVFWQQYGARFRDLFPERSAAPSCAGAGILGAVASIAANLQALEIVKLITGNGVPKVGEVVSLQTASLTVRSYRLPNALKPQLLGVIEQATDHGWTVEMLRQKQSIGVGVEVIDLRSKDLFDRAAIPGADNLRPESVLENWIVDDGHQSVLLVCEEGIVSSLLAEAIRSRGDQRVFHLIGGYTSWLDAN